MNPCFNHQVTNHFREGKKTKQINEEILISEYIYIYIDWC